MIMPTSLTGFYRGGNAGMAATPATPGRSGLSLSDLYRRPVRAQRPEVPEYARSASDLPPDVQARLRRERILRMIQQGVAAGPSGRTGEAMLGAVLDRGGEEGEIERYRREQEGQYQNADRAALEEARLGQQDQDEAGQEQLAGEALRLYQEIDAVAGEAAPPFVEQAKVAALNIDLKTLAKMREIAEQVAIVAREAKAAGIDPNDEAAVEAFANERQYKQETALGIGRSRDRIAAGVDRDPNREGAGAAPPSLQRFEANGKQYVFDPRSGQTREIPGAPTETKGFEGKDGAWASAQAKAEREEIGKAKGTESPEYKNFDMAGAARRAMSTGRGIMGGTGSTAPAVGAPSVGAAADPKAVAVSQLKQASAKLPSAAAAEIQRALDAGEDPVALLRELLSDLQLAQQQRAGRPVQ